MFSISFDVIVALERVKKSVERVKNKQQQQQQQQNHWGVEKILGDKNLPISTV